jgi:hypothetical protein
MVEALFFTENYLKLNSAVSYNLDYSDLRPFIEPAQHQLIKLRVGLKLYERLSEAIINKDWNGDELELLRLVKPAVMYYSIYLALPFLQTKIKNKGLVKSADQFIQTVSGQDMMNLRQEVLNMSNFYMSRFEEWFCLNTIKFPQYSDPDQLNSKEYSEPYDLGGFLPFKGRAIPNDVDAILKIINYKKR